MVFLTPKLLLNAAWTASKSFQTAKSLHSHALGSIAVSQRDKEEKMLQLLKSELGLRWGWLVQSKQIKDLKTIFFFNNEHDSL